MEGRKACSALAPLAAEAEGVTPAGVEERIESK